MEIRSRRRKSRIPEDEIITIENVTKAYTKGAPALNGINLHIKRGEFVFIVGKSGSGKSTLIKLLLRELTATGGNITVMGYNLNKIRHSRIPKYRRNIGVVFQDFRLLEDRNVYENVALAQRVVQVPAREIRRNVSVILERVGLGGKYKSKITHISGGEQQRVALARALVNKPSILLCDEPTGNLDPEISLEIMNLIDKINASGTTVIVVTHDKAIVNMMEKRVVTLQKGVITSDEEHGSYNDEDEE